MELLEKPRLRDHIERGAAFALALVCVGAALLAWREVRIAAALVAELAGFRRGVFRVMNVALIIIMGICWFVYTLWVVDAHLQAHTKARVDRVRERPVPDRYVERPVSRWLWRHNLHLALNRFLKNLVLPVAIYGLARLLQVILVGLAS